MLVATETVPSSAGSATSAGSPVVPNRPLDRQTHLASLMQDLRSGRELAMVKALTATGLSLVAIDRKLASTFLEGLPPPQRKAVMWYHNLVVSVGQALAQGSDVDPQQIAAQIEQQFGDLLIRIRAVRLCRRVRGFGDFDPFEDNRFIAGRTNSMVLYVELDRYHVHKQSTGMHEVSLSQEVILYTDSGGTAVWKHPSVGIFDLSRNRRRDFFVTQVIRLPPTLSIGKYILKIAVTDRRTGTVDEAEAPLEVMADTTLVRSR